MSNLQELLLEKNEKEELEDLLQQINDLQQIQADLASIIGEQRETVEHIGQEINQVNQNVEMGTIDIKKARFLNTKFIPIMFGAIVGGVVAGPVGAAAGLKAGIATGVGLGGSALGGILGYKVQK